MCSSIANAAVSPVSQTMRRNSSDRVSLQIYDVDNDFDCESQFERATNGNDVELDSEAIIRFADILMPRFQL